MRMIRHPASGAVFVGVGVMVGAVLAGCGDDTAAPAAVWSDADSLSELPSTPSTETISPDTTMPVAVPPPTDDYIHDDFADGSMLDLGDSLDDERVFVLPEDLPDDFYDDLPDDLTTAPDDAFTDTATVQEPIDWTSLTAEAGADLDLAALIPATDDIGAHWKFRDMDVVESGPPDPDADVPGCDVEPPPDLGGVNARFHLRGAIGDEAFNSDGKLELSVLRADPNAIDAFVDSFHELFDCPVESLVPIATVEELDVALPASVVFARRAEQDTVDWPGQAPQFVADAVILFLRNDPYLVVVYVDLAHLVDDQAPFVTADEAVRVAWLVDDLM